MTQSHDRQLDNFYQYVLDAAKLRTIKHAKVWTEGTLEILGTVLDRRVRRVLSKNLPEELTDSLGGIFWLLHFRDTNMSAEDFCQRVARRSGNSDPEYARVPVGAVFGGLRLYIGPDLEKRIVDSLPPEIGAIWVNGQTEEITLAR